MDKLDVCPARLLRVRAVVGSMRQIVPENLEQCYAVLIKDTVAEGSILEIKSLPVTARCKDCDWNGEMSRDWFFCHACSSPRIEITGGKELYLDNMQIETDD